MLPFITITVIINRTADWPTFMKYRYCPFTKAEFIIEIYENTQRIPIQFDPVKLYALPLSGSDSGTVPLYVCEFLV